MTFDRNDDSLLRADDPVEIKLFTELQTVITAAIAGPLPAGLLIFVNFRALGKEKEAIMSLALTFLFTLTLVFMIYALPESMAQQTPTIFITLIFGAIVYLFYRRYMYTEVNKALEAGASKRSGWAVVGVALVGLLLNIAIMAALAADGLA